MKLIELTAMELKEGLERGEYSSVDLVKALHDHADKTESQIGGFTAELRERALKDAAHCDKLRRQGQILGPLHGLAITVKDNIDVAGLPSSIGLKERGISVATNDAVLVQCARKAGAFVLGKSNVPQGLLSMNCDNNLYGPSFNPWSRSHVTGGSSSGEAALIAGGASVMGFGTDLGGSVRFPAAFCGVHGFKPTQDLWSNQGVRAGLPGQEFVRAQTGALARSSADLELLLQALSPKNQARHDPRVPPLTLPDASSLRGLRIGYALEDGFIRPAPVMQRAVRQALGYLEDAGAELVPFQGPFQKEIIELYIAGMSGDGMSTLRRQFRDDEVKSTNKVLWLMGTLPKSMRRVADQALQWAGESQLALALRSGGRKSVAETWALTARRNELTQKIAAVWAAQKLDAVITPASASPAIPIGLEGDASLIFSYYGRYNLLRMPAGVVPITKVQRDETEIDLGPQRTLKRIEEAAKRSAGLPVAVQVAGPRWQDWTVLRVMSYLERRARDDHSYPQTPVLHSFSEPLNVTYQAKEALIQ